MSKQNPSTRPSLEARRHAVYTLAPDLLLVFKPKGHQEAEHAHDYRQRLRVLRGRLSVRLGARSVILHPSSKPLSLRSRQRHATTAPVDTWVCVEIVGARGK